MKQGRKASNIVIREASKKSGRSLQIDKKDKRNTLQSFELQKDLLKAENLTQEQQIKIRQQAQKLVVRKSRMTQKRIEGDMIEMLQNECNKLMRQLEQQRIMNERLRVDIEEMQKKIVYLNTKMQGFYSNNENLTKHKNNGQLQNQQLREEIGVLQSKIRRIEDENLYLKGNSQNKDEKWLREVEQLKEMVEGLKRKEKKLEEDKEEIIEEFQEKRNQCNRIRECFQNKKKQWDAMRLQFQTHSKQNLGRKGQKIAKLQAQNQNLAEQLRNEEGLRKKTVQKNKELEKEMGKRQVQVQQLEQQIAVLKKRVNDLSILKSTNNNIMTQKITQLTNDNQLLRKQLETLPNSQLKHTQEKPILFGTHDPQ